MSSSRKRYNDEEKRKIIEEAEAGTPVSQIAEKYGISKSTIYTIIRKQKGTSLQKKSNLAISEFLKKAIAVIISIPEIKSKKVKEFLAKAIAIIISILLLYLTKKIFIHNPAAILTKNDLWAYETLALGIIISSYIILHIEDFLKMFIRKQEPTEHKVSLAKNGWNLLLLMTGSFLIYIALSKVVDNTP
jgi:transposase-like protein